VIYLEFPSNDPYFNLAFEQFVFDYLDKKESYFMLWQNANSIIIGKNQNTSEEINSVFVKEHNISVARRLSGGGAVYHDLGNLNFTFIMDAANASHLDLKLFCEPIKSALASLGVKAEISGRNDITIDGKKFSGNAQYIKGARVMHHGTIMYSSDLAVVGEALSVSKDKIESKGFKSVRSRVTNVSEHIKNPISMEEFKQVLIEHIFKDQNKIVYPMKEEDLKIVQKLRDEKYATWEWNYGKSPKYSIRKKRRVEGCGKIEVCMSADKGIITDMRFYGDFFGLNDTCDLAKLFIGKKTQREVYEEILSNIKAGDYFNNLSNEELINILLH
jgi:lipoate-protein ligase A